MKTFLMLFSTNLVIILSLSSCSENIEKPKGFYDKEYCFSNYETFGDVVIIPLYYPYRLRYKQTDSHAFILEDDKDFIGYVRYLDVMDSLIVGFVYNDRFDLPYRDTSWIILDCKRKEIFNFKDCNSFYHKLGHLKKKKPRFKFYQEYLNKRIENGYKDFFWIPKEYRN